MRLGSQPLTPHTPRGTGPVAAPRPDAAPTAGGSADVLARSGGAGDTLRALKQSLVSIFNRLLGRTPPAPAPVVPPPAPAPAPAPPSGLRAKAEAVWFKGVSLDSAFRKGERDAADVNQVDAPADEEATRLLEANRPVESERLKALSEKQRAQYDQVVEAVASDPQALLAMQVLLAEGKLPGKVKSSAGADLLTTLGGLAAAPVSPHIDRGAMLADLVQEIAVPSAINQQDKNTCCVASVQMLTAMQNPAEYARIVGGLASPDGAVTLANGSTLAREPGTDADDNSGRTAPSRLWQAAMTQFAMGDVGYDNATDSRNDGKWGVFGHELDRVVDALTNRDNPLLSVEGDYTGADMLRDVTKHANAGHPVPVCLDWGEKDKDGDEHPGHDILVTAVKDGRVFYNNPWGLQESMTTAEFEQRAWWANPIDMTK
jgi:hypothetical protein